GLAAADARLGLTETVPGSEGYWGRTTTTVGDRIRLLDAIVTGPLAEWSDYVLDLMTHVVPEQGWGITAASSPDDLVAIKNGWIDDDAGLWTINSVGRVTGPAAATGGLASSPDVDVTIVVLSDGQADFESGAGRVGQNAA